MFPPHSVCLLNISNTCFPIFYRESARLASGRAVNVAQSSRFLTALIFPDSHLSVLSYNRCVSAYPQGVTEELFLEQMSTIFTMEAVEECDLQASGCSSPRATDRALSCISDTSTVASAVTDSESRSDSMDLGLRAGPSPAQDPHAGQHVMHMYVGEQWYRLHAEPLSPEEVLSDPLRGVGCQILADKVLRPLLRTDDASSGAHMIYGTYLWSMLGLCPVSDHMQSFSFSLPFVFAVDGREGSGGVARQVQAGNAVVGFLMSAVPAECIMRVADAGQLLPAKVSDCVLCIGFTAVKAFICADFLSNFCAHWYSYLASSAFCHDQATFFDPKPMTNMLLRLLR